MKLTTVCFLFFFLAGAFSLPRSQTSLASMVHELNSLDPSSGSSAESIEVQVRSKRSSDGNGTSSGSMGVVSTLTDTPLPSSMLDILKTLGVTDVKTVQDLLSSALDGSLMREILGTVTTLPATEIEKLLKSTGLDNIPPIGTFVTILRNALSVPGDIAGSISNMISTVLRAIGNLFSGLIP